MISRILIFLLLLISSMSSQATEVIGSGKIKSLSYRTGDVLFQVYQGNTNLCSQCAADASGMSSGGFCWAKQLDKNLISMVLTAYSTNKNVSGRVASWAQCELYQFHVEE